jgi:hypothetical protein
MAMSSFKKLRIHYEGVSADRWAAAQKEVGASAITLAGFT